MKFDALGRVLKPGDVCGLAGRRGSQTTLETIIVREVFDDGSVKGVKLVNERVEGKGWVTNLVPTRPIKVTKNLIITGLTEKEAIDYMKAKKEK